MFIYMLLNSVNGKAYIGQTTNSVAIRWQGHIYEAKHDKMGRPICKAITKYGPEAFTVTQLCSATSIDELDELERFFILLLNTTVLGYNATIGGQSGCRPSAATLEKLSKIRRGKPKTAAARKNMSLSRLGKPRPAHVRQMLINQARSAAETRWAKERG